MPSHLGASILSNKLKILNKYVFAFDGFKDKVYYRDTDSLYKNEKTLVNSGTK